MIKGLVLPHWPSLAQNTVQAMSGNAFDRLDQLDQAEQFTTCVAQRSQQEMHMLGHDDGGMHQQLGSVVVKAVFEHNVASLGRKGISCELPKSNEKRVFISL